MKTVKILSALLLSVVMITSCNSGKKQSEESGVESTPAVSETAAPEDIPVEIKQLSGYFLKNSYELPKEVNVIEVVDNDQMKLVFGVGKTMNNKVDAVDFNTSAVIGVALQPTDIKTDMKIEKVEKSGDALNVYVLLVKGEKQSFTTKPVILFSFSKLVDVKEVKLFIDGENKDVLPLKFKNI